MSDVKLMKPLFFGGAFNKSGKRMRAILEKEVSDGEKTYRLWRSAGAPDIQYPRAENDKYILHVEINGYLLPVRETEFSIIDRCGFKAAAEKLYGGVEKRDEYYGALRKSSRDPDRDISQEIARESEEIRRSGSDPALQARYIRSIIQNEVDIYLKAKKNGGDSFPSYGGALALGELDQCSELMEIHNKKRDDRIKKNWEEQERKNKEYCEKQNQSANDLVKYTIHVIKAGGTIENEKVTFHKTPYDYSSYSIINYLMRLYGIKVPLRTQGWVNEHLRKVKIEDGRCSELQYMRSKNGKCSTKIFDCLNELVEAVTKSEMAVSQNESGDEIGLTG